MKNTFPIIFAVLLIGGGLLIYTQIQKKRPSGKNTLTNNTVVQPEKEHGKIQVSSGKTASSKKKLSEEENSDPFLMISVDHPILVFQNDGPTTATLTAQFENFKPITLVWKSQISRINPLAAKQPATFSVNNNSQVETVATFPVPGVYQIQLTANDGRKTLKRKTWIHVWDSTSSLTPGKVGAYPDILPPSVRQLAPDPGPFKHPRLAVTDREWPEISSRNKKDQFASYALEILKCDVADKFDNPNESVGQLAEELDNWFKSGGTGKEPDAARINNDFYVWLYRACYLAWLELDPAKPKAAATPEQRARREYLARVTAAAAKIQFNAQWDRASKKFKTDNPSFIKGIDRPGEGIDSGRYAELPNCYDLIYDWMTDEQRKIVRDFLYAVSYARHYSAAFSWHPVHGPPGLPMNVHGQNGDFGNLSDYGILASLVIEGEEDAVSDDVRKVFSTPASKSNAHIWMKPSPEDDPSAWPYSTVASVDNLHRQLRMLNEGFASPWGFWITHGAYMGLSTGNFLPASFAMARRGENIFITSYFYSCIQMYLYSMQPGEGTSSLAKRNNLPEPPPFTSNIYNFDHHDGGGPVNPYQNFIFKYMYPDDPVVDYVTRNSLPGLWRWGWKLDNPLICSMYGMMPGTKSKVLPLERAAEEKKLPLLKFDPSKNIVLARAGWNEEDLNIWFDCDSVLGSGHQHAEKNNFSLYALGRAWSSPPGYHCTISDVQSLVMIQDSKFIKDKATNGYIGESPSSATNTPPLPGNFPTPPGKLLEVKESQDLLYAMMAGDATYAYTCGYRGERKIDTGKKASYFMYPGYADYLLRTFGDVYQGSVDEELKVSQDDYNPVQYAIRTLLLVRGKHPYVLIVDDINKNGKPQNYRWVMSSASSFYPGGDKRFINAKGEGTYSSLAIMPGATKSQAILYHSPIDDEKELGQKGLPRLLVCDLGKPSLSKKQPAIFLESRPPSKDMKDYTYLCYGGDNNRGGKITYICSNRLIIERRNVAEPNYTVLLFPYLTGEPLPKTVWNKERTELTIDFGDGTVDKITFDRANPDHRTRLTVKRNNQD